MSIGIEPTNILLPKVDDLTSFAVVACDQFTSEEKYWKTLETQVKGKKTAFDLILPEIYLDEKVDERIKKINKNIEDYLENKVFYELPKGFILTVRKTKYKERRIGLIGALDLEEYDYKNGAKTLIRATEGTIEERIPPRLKIRKDAPLEFPHIMVLYDDEKREINETLYKNREKLEKVYSFDLNMDGGHLDGYFVKDYKEILDKFSKLLDSDRLIKKYGFDDKFLFAVGDGNHSLATAKTHWENLKKTLTKEEIKSHPARYALVEFLNIYDDGIYFEPIYRYISGIDTKKFIEQLKNIDLGNVKIISKDCNFEMKGTDSIPQGIKNADSFIKDYISKFAGKVDYIHGENNIKKIVNEDNNSVGILFNKIDKKDLFKYVSNNGTFPRKTFSMGEGIEKRYYLESRKIK